MEETPSGNRDGKGRDLMTIDYALFTDLYQITMAQGYWEHGMADTEAFPLLVAASFSSRDSLITWPISN